LFYDKRQIYAHICPFTLRRKGSIYNRTLKGSKALRIWNPKNSMHVNDHQIRDMVIIKCI